MKIKFYERGDQMDNKITRDSWELIAENIVHIVENNSQDYDAAINELEDYLTDEGIITVVNEVIKCKWCTKKRWCELSEGEDCFCEHYSGRQK